MRTYVYLPPVSSVHVYARLARPPTTCARGKHRANAVALATRSQIISILDIVKPPSLDDFKEIYCACRLPASRPGLR